MALYDPQRVARIDPADAAAAVHAFLKQARDWAEKEIPRRTERVARDPRPEEAAKLYQWISYLAFTDHAMRELERGDLDHWFHGEARLAAKEEV